MRDPRRGGTLPVAMVAVAGLAIVALASYRLIRAQVRETLWQARSIQAQAIAEAGIEDAMTMLVLNSRWRTGFNQKPFVGGFYTVKLSTDQVPWVTSTGFSASITKFGRAYRVVKAQALFDGFYNFADSTFTVNWFTTAYDSVIDRTPTCRSTAMTTNGCLFGDHILANTTLVTAAGGIRVNGDADYGLQTATAPAAATVSGKITFVSTDTVDVEPSDGTDVTCSTCNDNNRLPTIAYNRITQKLTVTSTMTINMSSGVYYLKGISSSGTWNSNMTSSLYTTSIYLNGGLWIGGANGVLDTSNNCTANGGGCKAYNFHIYCQAGNNDIISLNGSNQVSGTQNVTYVDIYCPQDRVVINQRMLGRLIGRSVVINNPYGNGNNRPIFLFDLQFGFTKASGSRWVSGSWTEDF